MQEELQHEELQHEIVKHIPSADVPAFKLTVLPGPNAGVLVQPQEGEPYFVRDGKVMHLTPAALPIQNITGELRMIGNALVERGLKKPGERILRVADDLANVPG